MRKAAALIFAACGLLLLLTWQNDGHWYWLWEEAQYFPPRYFHHRFDFNAMGSLDFGLKVAGLAFVAVALLLFRRAERDH